MTVKRRETYKGIIGLVVLCLLIVGLISFGVTWIDKRTIATSMRQARLALDTDAIALIHGRLQAGEFVSNTTEYKALTAKLKLITETFHGDARWSYIAAPDIERSTSRLTILTIDSLQGVPSTQANYVYNIEKYPAMQKAIYDNVDIIVSPIVYDTDYGFLTRAGFARLYDSNGIFVGVLGVDMSTWHIVYVGIIILCCSAIIILLAGFAWLQLAQGLGLIMSPRQYDCYHKNQKGCE
jgi:hypothetical protein